MKKLITILLLLSSFLAKAQTDTFPTIHGKVYTAAGLYTAIGGFDGKLSSLTGMTASNTIANTNKSLNLTYDATSDFLGIPFYISSNTSSITTSTQLQNNTFSGANAASSVTTWSLYTSNTRTGTSSTNVGAQFNASGGTNNYALIVGSGNTGLGGMTAPTARVQLGQGSATAGTAPLKFTAATPTTTPEVGALNFNTGLLMLDSSNSVRDTMATRSWTRNNITGGGSSGGNVYQDANKNVGVNNVDSNYNQITSAGTTSTLTAGSKQVQDVVGSANQTVQLPSGTAIQAGHNYYIMASTSGTVPVTDGAGGALLTLAAGTTASFTLQTAGSTAGTWKKEYSLTPLATGVSGILPAANGGTGVANSSTITLGGAVSTAGVLTTAGALITTGAFSLTLTSTATTVATLPSGTVTLAGLGTTQTFTGANTFNNANVLAGAATMAVFNTTATNLSFGGAATTLNIGITSTATETHNYSTGATANAATKTINFGTAGVSGSITNINIGSVVSGSTGTTTIGNLLKWATFSINIPTTSTPTTGGTVAAATTQWNVINPAGTLATLTITPPVSPTDGEEVDYSFTQIITALTFAGGTLNAPITSAAADSFIRLGYVNSLTKWVRK